MGLVDHVVQEWNNINNAINFKIALGKEEAKWCERHGYKFKGVEPEDESIPEALINGLIWTTYIVRHPIRFSQAYWYSLKELENPSDMF